MSHREGFHRVWGGWRPSAAQRRVLDGVAVGRTNAEIAVSLGLSAETVKWHVAQLLAESGCEDRDALGRWWRARREHPLRVPLLVLTARAATVLALAGLVIAAVLAGVALRSGSSGVADMLQPGSIEAPIARAAPAATPEPSLTPTVKYATNTLDPVRRIRVTLPGVPTPAIDEADPDLKRAIEEYAGDAGIPYAGECETALPPSKLIRAADTCAILEFVNSEQAILRLFRMEPLSIQRVTFENPGGRWLPIIVERIY